MEQVALYTKPWVYFWTVQTLGLLLFAAGIAYKASIYTKGRRLSLNRQASYILIWKAFWQEVVLQKQLADKSAVRWLIHISVFYGFIGLLILSAFSVALEMFIPRESQFSLYMLQGAGHNYYKFAGDLFGLLILLGILAAIARRYLFKDRQLNTDAADTTALAALLVLIVTGFLLEAARIALSAPAPEFQHSFIGFSLSGIFNGVTGLKSVATGLWALHATLNAVLLAYIPHSKFMHIINSPVEIVLNASEERMRGDLYR